MGNPSYFAGNASLLAPLACTVDSTPPTFAGITGLTQNANGSLTASWSAATDSSPPIEYMVFIQATTATGLFSTIPVQTVKTLSATIFTDSLGTLINGTTYHVGVRASDAVGVVETNTVSMSQVSLGVPSTSLINLINGLITTIGTPVLATVSLDINSREPAADPKLLNLDATVSSRATQASVTAIPTNPLLTTDVRLNDLDAAISSRAPSATALSTAQWTNGRASNLDNLDAPISTVNLSVSTIQTLVQEINDIEKGRWHIVGNQMIFYKPDNVTEIFRCNLFNQASIPSMTNVYQRVKV